jgi:hypothetical protein
VAEQPVGAFDDTSMTIISGSRGSFSQLLEKALECIECGPFDIPIMRLDRQICY